VLAAAIIVGAGAPAMVPVAGGPRQVMGPGGDGGQIRRQPPHGADAQMVAAVADRTMQMDLERWDWDTAVAVHGLVVAAEAAGYSPALEYAARWAARRFAAGTPEVGHPNAVAGGLVLLDLYAATGDRRYLDDAVDVARRAQGLPRVEGGGFAHAPGELWVDTLYMTVPFLARMSLVTGDMRWLDEAVAQYRAHAAALQDPRTGLFRHAAVVKEPTSLPAIPWLRGNGWAAAAAADLLAALSPDDPRRGYVEAAARRQLEALAALQSDTGGWSTVVDEFAFYEETSGAAAVAYATYLGLDGGWLGPRLAPVAARGRTGLLAEVDADGTVGDVSVGTGPQADPAGYNRMAHDEAQPWGQGWALLLLAQPPAGFRWSAEPPRVVIAPGDQAKTDLAVTVSWGGRFPVDFTTLAVPRGLEARVMAPPGVTAALIVSAAPDAVAGRREIGLRGEARTGDASAVAPRLGAVIVDVVTAPGRLYLPAVAVEADPRYAERALVADAGASWQPVEDSNGTMAFVADRFGARRVFVMPPEDSPRVVRVDGVAADRPRFGPDGALHLAVRHPDTGWDLAEWRGGPSTGAATEPLGRPPGDQMQPDPDPRGARLAYAEAPARRWGLLLLDLPSGAAEGVAAGTARVPAWSPGGDRLAYRAEVDGNSDVYFVDMNTRAAYRVTHDLATDGYPAFSPGGDCIAFVSDRGLDSAIYTVDAFGGGLNRVTSGAGDTTPSWSQDGRILFASDRRGASGLYAVAASCPAPRAFPPADLADSVWNSMAAFLLAHPEAEAIGPGASGNPDPALAAETVRRACEGWPELADVFGPGAHRRACESGVADSLALYHAARAWRSGDGQGG